MLRHSYKDWPGKNKFLFYGKVVLGPDVHMLVLSIVFILIPSIVFPGGVVPYYFIYTPLYVSIPILCLSICASIAVLVLLLITASMDPGIIPRNRQNFEKDSNSLTDARVLPSNIEYVFVNGKKTKVKYCYSCKIYRPPRASHCSRCDNCVERWDHHCPWTGTCVGRRNYRYFTAFLYVTTLSMIIGLGLCVAQIVIMGFHLRRENFDLAIPEIVGKSILYSPPAVILIIYFFAFLFFVGTLCVFHTYLSCANQTTYERIKKQKNRFKEGPIKNFVEIHCTKIPASKLNFREEENNV